MPPAERGAEQRAQCSEQWREQWRGVRRILVLRLDNLGDMVMLSPALRTFKQTLPDASITLLASPNGSQMAPLLPWVDEVMVHKPVWQDLGGAIPQSPERELALVDELKEGDFDAAAIFTSFSQSPWPPAYVCHLAGIPLRLGQSGEFGGSLLNQWVTPPPFEGHQVDRNLHLLEAAGFTPAGRHLELAIPPQVQEAADRLLEKMGIDPHSPFLALAPGASCPSRRYAPGRFAEAAAGLARESGLPQVLLGSEKEIPFTRPVLEAAAGAAVSLAGQSSVPEMAAIINRSRLLLANHSGPMHIADALRRPMVILYSGTEYESQWRPRTAPAQLLRRETACSPCYGFTCPYALECLDIPPTEVVEAVMRMLEATQPPRKEVRQYETT